MSQIGAISFSFRFRGRTKRIMAIYRCFIEHSGKALHPRQIERYTGIRMLDVADRMQATPEIFVKLPKRDGITRYRLTSTISTCTPEEVEKMVLQKARHESWLFYAVVTMILLGFLIAIMTIAPAI